MSFEETEEGQTRSRPRIILLCHSDAPLDYDGMARWLASFGELAGIVRITERPDRMKKRVKAEISRIGYWRFLDVLAFRIYYRLFLAARDRQFEKKELARLQALYPAPQNVPALDTHSPNSKATRLFLEKYRPDIVIARCKFILAKRIFAIPATGSFVMHPGICPEYRNAHGCFWALANDDLEKVGVTLLKIDAGVDTGPVYGYFSYPYDELKESHIVIQERCVSENHDRLAARLLEIYHGEASAMDTSGRKSNVWGQPWLSRYLAWRWKAARRAK
jgi:folate-dependent phosphoribosylglycinamide formyltransferase PurN